MKICHENIEERRDMPGKAVNSGKVDDGHIEDDHCTDVRNTSIEGLELLLRGCNFQHCLEDQNVRHNNQHKGHHNPKCCKKAIDYISLVVRAGQLHDILVEAVRMG